MYADRMAIEQRLCRIDHKIIVLSGKGGVGKSTMAANMALWLSLSDKETGLLDIDFHGPSIPRLLNLEGASIDVRNKTMIPPETDSGLKVMSLGFMLRGRDDAVIWRGPMKIGAMKQLLRDTEWGDLDYLVVDCPPGTGDEPLSICQWIENPDGAVVVTTPQELALLDVRKSINFCRTLDLPVLGVVENMSGFACPQCGEIVDIFKKGGGEQMAREMSVPFLGRVPIDPEIVRSGDAGELAVGQKAGSGTQQAFDSIGKAILEQITGSQNRSK